MDRYGKRLPDERRKCCRRSSSVTRSLAKQCRTMPTARTDEELLKEMREAIRQQFALRDIFKIPDAPKPDCGS